jgi:tRNA(Ile)-lysidine synthase
MPMSTDDSAMADACLERVQATLRNFAILAPGERVLAAVSGGPDSVCLLHILCRLRFPVEVAHFDHQTRGGESAADAVFVRALADGLGVPFHLESRAIVEECRGLKDSFEQHARRARYEFLVRTAKARACAAIATGHHADDLAETVLMRVLRGTTASGLAGIPPVRFEGQMRIVRPLISCTRTEILAYLSAHGLPYRTDLSNEDTRYLRNKVRHELLPCLARDYNPKVRAALIRLSESMRCENDFLNAAAEKAFAECGAEEGIERRTFGGLHPALQRRIVLILAWRHGVDCPFDRVCGAADFISSGSTGARFDLGGGLHLVNGRTCTKVAPESQQKDAVEIVLAFPGVTQAFGRTFTTRCLDSLPEQDLARYCSPSRQVFDADLLGTELTVRRRRPGDRFTPYGMSGTRKLQDYLVDLGVPVWERDAQVIMLGNGRIAWIVGHAISAHAAVTADTRRIVEIEVMNAPE